MRLYLTHSTSFDYQNELYEPLKQSVVLKHSVFFPHDNGNAAKKSKDIIPQSDYVLAEVSHPSTGQGIELGWADAAGVPIVCFHRAGSRVSGSLRFISQTFIEYSSTADMTEKLTSWLDSNNRKNNESIVNAGGLSV